MSTDFYSAVQQLVSAHAREVDNLQRQLASRYGSGSTLTVTSSLANAQALEVTKNLSLAECPEHMSQEPLSPRPFDTPRMAPSRIHQSPPITPRSPREENVDSMSANQHKTSTLSWAISVDNERPSSGLSSKISADCSDETIYSQVTNAILRWQVLTHGALTNRSVAHYVVHPGWTQAPEKDESFGALPTKTVSESHAHKLVFAQEENAAKLAQTSRSGSAALLTRAKSMTGLKGKRSRKHNTSDTLVLHPEAPLRRAWILLCSIVFLYEIFAITMAPFRVLDGNNGRMLEFCSAVFWSCDIFITFLSGVYVKGVPELRFLVVATFYARTWLAFDVIVVVCQWCALLIESLSSLDTTIFLRLFRVVRSFRLGRVIYWLRDEFGLSRAALSRGKLVHIMILLYVFTHCCACLLYAVGKLDGGWVSHYHDRLQDEDLDISAAHNYLVCLHWTFSQLQGNVDLYPGTTSTGNLLFVVFSSSCSIVALTLFVSSATDTLQDVRQQKQRQLDKERLLSEFFRRHDVDPEVKHRADYYLNLKRKQQKAMERKDNDEEALKMFPKQLRAQLLTEMWGASISWHPLFGYLNKQARNLFVKFCANAMKLQTYEPNDDVFIAGEESSCGHIISKGEFVVNLVAETSPVFAGTPSTASSTSNISPERSPCRKIPASPSSPPSSPSSPQRLSMSFHLSGSKPSSNRRSGRTSKIDYLEALLDRSRPARKVISSQFVSEISLWMPWVHVGNLCSAEHGHCFEISREELIATLKPHYSPYVVFGSYAQRFVEAAKLMKQNILEFELMSFLHVAEWDAREEIDTSIEE